MPETVSTPTRILFIDDDADVRRAAAILLGRRGFEVLGAASPTESWSMLAAQPVDLVLLDLNFARGAVTGEEGLAHLRALLAHDPACVVVVVTGHSGIAIAVAAMRNGAADFVMKPWHNDRLVQTLEQAAALARQRRDARPETATPAAIPVVGQSAAMTRLMALLHRAAPTPAPILLAGAPGTGKTLLAQTIHRLSPRAGEAMVTLDPGSTEDVAHAVAAAQAGTLVLDDPGGLSPPVQARLIQALEARPGPRLVACTRHPPPAYGMGADLLSRLGTVVLHLPALADRPGDVKLLADHFTRIFAQSYRRPGLGLSAEAAASVASCPWPGQVREMRHAIERAVVLADGPMILSADLALQPAAPPPPEGMSDLNLAHSEKSMVQAALRRHGFNVSHAARELGITRATLYRRMARHGL